MEQLREGGDVRKGRGRERRGREGGRGGERRKREM